MDDDYRGKNYRGIEKQKRIALKDMMEDFYIEESDFLEYKSTKNISEKNHTNYGYDYPKNNQKKITLSLLNTVYFTKKHQKTIFYAKSKFSEGFDVISRLKENNKYKHLVMLRIISFLDLDSKVAFSLTCKHFYQEFYVNQNCGIIISSSAQNLSNILTPRGIYIYSRDSYAGDMSTHYRYYVYNGTKNFSGKELLQQVLDSIEITSKDQLDVLESVNKDSPNLIKSRFNLSMIKQSDRYEVFLWQAVFQQNRLESFPYLSRKYIYEDIVDRVHFINDKLFYITTKSNLGYSCDIYEAKIDGIENYLNQPQEKFQKASTPICQVLCYKEVPYEIDESWAKPVIIEKDFLADNIKFLVSSGFIYMISKSDQSIFVIDIHKRKLISTIKAENLDFENYIESPFKNFFALDKNNYIHHLMFEHLPESDDVKFNSVKLINPLLKSITHNIHYTFTHIHDSQNELTEYLVYFSGQLTSSAFFYYNVSSKEIGSIAVSEPLSWNVHRDKLMMLTENHQLILFNLITHIQIFCSNKFEPFKTGQGRVGLVFDWFHVILAVQTSYTSVELYCHSYPLLQSQYLQANNKAPFHWTLSIAKIGDSEKQTSRYLDFRFDNNFVFLRGENGTVLIDFLSIMRISRSKNIVLVELSQFKKPRVEIPKKLRQKKEKKNNCNTRKPIEAHITRLSYIPDIKNELREDEIVGLVYLKSIKDYDLPEEQQKDWPDILEESKNLTINEKTHLIAKTYRNMLRGYDFRRGEIGKELDYIIKKSNERKKEIGKIRTKQRAEKQSNF